MTHRPTPLCFIASMEGSEDLGWQSIGDIAQALAGEAQRRREMKKVGTAPADPERSPDKSWEETLPKGSLRAGGYDTGAKRLSAEGAISGAAVTGAAFRREPRRRP